MTSDPIWAEADRLEADSPLGTVLLLLTQLSPSYAWRPPGDYPMSLYAYFCLYLLASFPCLPPHSLTIFQVLPSQQQKDNSLGDYLTFASTSLLEFDDVFLLLETASENHRQDKFPWEVLGKPSKTTQIFPSGGRGNTP